MKNAGHDESILTGQFLLIGSGENYNSEIVSGKNLFKRFIEMQYGFYADCPPDELQRWRDEFDEPDNWRNDIDYGAIHYETDIGETDHIEIYRITDAALPVTEAAPPK